MAIRRQLNLLTVDYKLFLASFGDDMMTQCRDAGLVHRDKDRTDRNLEKIVAKVLEDRKIARDSGRESPPPALGIRHTQQLIKHDLDGGLCYLYELTTAD